MTSLLLLLAFLALQADAAAAKKKAADEAGVQEITIKGKGPSGPPIRLPPLAPDAAIADEVAATLDVLKVEHRSAAPQLRLPGGPAKRLSRPFPEPPYLSFNPQIFQHPYERWTFEVLAGERVLWRSSGRGQAQDRIEWDGTDDTGRMVARVGQAYHFRFTGYRDGEELGVTSETIELGSMLYRESLGDVRMEVASVLLFPTKRATLLDSASPYLSELGQRLRRLNPKYGPITLTLFQRDPDSALAKRRAKVLKEHFAKLLIVHPSQLHVELKLAEERGEVLAGVLPPDGGAVIRDR